jgi:hypothetical protein
MAKRQYENKLFPIGNFYRTHKLWTNEEYTSLDRLKCFLGIHVTEFRLFGITEHCACCGWYHNTTVKHRIRHLLQS